MSDRSWPKNERSTRNCFNCIADGIAVKCRKDRPMLYERTDLRLESRTVEKNTLLFPCCKGCNDFDNNWE